MTDVMTVRGPIPAAELGFTLPHEHIYLNLMMEHRATGLLHDPALMEDELAQYARAGGRTLVECTNMGLGRDPLGLRRISSATGLHIVMGCGLYRNPYLDVEWVDRHSVDQIAEVIIQDLTVGADGTDVRAGIIGEIASDLPFITAAEERSFRAAARAHLATGVPISTHAARWPVGVDQLDLLEEEGVDPRHVIIGHVDTVPDFEYHLELIRRGAWVQYDSIRGNSPHDTASRLSFLSRMAELGHLGRVLISHDVCNKTHLVNGGGTGFAYIPTTFLGLLRERGFDDHDLKTLTVTNPARALSSRTPEVE